jgi:hypothetical protein
MVKMSNGARAVYLRVRENILHLLKRVKKEEG